MNQRELLTYANSVIMAAISDRQLQFPVGGAFGQCSRPDVVVGRGPKVRAVGIETPASGTLCWWTHSKGCRASGCGVLATEVATNGMALPCSRRQIRPPPPLVDIGRRSSSSSSPPLPVCSGFNVWEDFARNGRDSELELDETGSLFSPRPVSAGSWTASEESLEPKSPRPIVGRNFNWSHQPVTTVDCQRHVITTASDNASGRHKHQARSSNGVTTGSQVGQQCCVLCRTNGEPKDIYQSHSLKDATGTVTCPVLYQYVCPYCGATGRRAHTIRYCPSAPPGVSVIKSLKTTRDSTGHRRPR